MDCRIIPNNSKALCGNVDLAPRCDEIRLRTHSTILPRFHFIKSLPLCRTSAYSRIQLQLIRNQHPIHFPILLSPCITASTASMKNPAQSSPQMNSLATPTTLRDATNAQNIGQKYLGRRKKNGPTCIACREKPKRRNQGIELRLAFLIS